MKKTSLVVLLGLVLSIVALTGCNQASDNSAPATNAPAAPANTNH
ncbi:MAG TPA: hypothetical protein VKV04_01035 [Verrucomicrobiae bacterium]|nr:hypothetical protein [Verrucomicrobiae bacterium]